MKSKRPLAINNSLVHGICNYSCRICGVNKPSYDGPKTFQDESVTKKLIECIENASTSGTAIRYVANAGDGEPTLHPDFSSRMALFGAMKRRLSDQNLYTPEISVVTNGSKLSQGAFLESIAENDITLIISFPTANPAHYGLIVFGKQEKGPELMEQVTDGIEKAFCLHALGKLKNLQFHISPPERDMVREDFALTVQYLSVLAKKYSVSMISMVLFPASSNRSGLVSNENSTFDTFSDIYRKFHNRSPYGVRIHLFNSMNRFFKSPFEIFDLGRSFRFPCFWNAQIFITADGQSICCNDQAVRNPMGDIFHDSIDGLMTKKEHYFPGVVCKACNQAPWKMKGSGFIEFWNFFTRVKLGSACSDLFKAAHHQ